MAINVPQLQNYLSGGLNIMVSGLPGTGKTAMLNQAVENLGWNMKYFSTPTLDPFVHLIGIPVPDTKTKTMNFYRDKTLEAADVIFFDEANRASDQIINAILEITQFHSLNGVKLPNLKSVVIAINPPGHDLSEGVEDLSTAFKDRFDIYLESTVDADYNYLKTKFGVEYARAGVEFFKEYQRGYASAMKQASTRNTMGYFSPRRLEKLMEIYMKFPKAETIRAVLPADVIVSAPVTHSIFSEALNVKNKPRKQNSQKLTEPIDEIHFQCALSSGDMRKKSNSSAFLSAYQWAKVNDPVSAQKLLTLLSDALGFNVGPKTIFTTWGVAVQDFSPTQRKILMRTWNNAKKFDTTLAFGW